MSAHVVMFSGGVGSWSAARRVADQHGTDGLTLLFTDTNIEDDDLYRFLLEAARNVLGDPLLFGWRTHQVPGIEGDIHVCLTPAGGSFVWITNDGRTPFDVFRQVRMLGSNRVAPCSRVLKQEPARAWVEHTYDPEHTTLYVGIDWSESHRLAPVQRGWAPWRVEAPMTQPPYVDKAQMLDALADAGIEQPRLYKMGMPHNNCGGGCVRAGHRQWKQLARVFPERFDWWAEQEQGVRDFLGRDDIAILRDRAGGVTTPLPLFDLRQRIDAQPSLFDDSEWGGCGCFLDVDDPEEDVA